MKISIGSTTVNYSVYILKFKFKKSLTALHKTNDENLGQSQ